MQQSDKSFHVVTVGWDPSVILGMLERVQLRSGIQFSHLVVSPRQLADFGDRGCRSSLVPLREHSQHPMPEPDLELLASLEADGVPTVHNMILSDRVVRRLPYEGALRYATFLARRLTEEFRRLRPSVVVGGFDGIHGGMGLAVARKMDIPWYAMYFTTLPQGLCGFCSGVTPDLLAPVDDTSETDMQALAEETLEEFLGRRALVAAYESPSSLLAVVQRLPLHLRVATGALTRLATGRHDRYTEYSVWRLGSEYLRRRRNLLLLPKREFLTEPPSEPYVLFGLHMQPESAIDTWAPFYTNQYNVVELLARSLPPSHRLLVKVHRSDADNYSPRQLKKFTASPGVKLVHPFAQSRDFIEKASAVAGIQGTMAVEAVLLSKSVLMFGDSPMHQIPGVERVDAHRDLPSQMRRLLCRHPPDPKRLLDGFARYLSQYGPGCYYDWERDLTDAEIGNLARRLEEVCEYSRGLREQ